MSVISNYLLISKSSSFVHSHPNPLEREVFGRLRLGTPTHPSLVSKLVAAPNDHHYLDLVNPNVITRIWT